MAVQSNIHANTKAKTEAHGPKHENRKMSKADLALVTFVGAALLLSWMAQIWDYIPIGLISKGTAYSIPTVTTHATAGDFRK